MFSVQSYYSIKKSILKIIILFLNPYNHVYAPPQANLIKINFKPVV